VETENMDEVKPVFESYKRIEKDTLANEYEKSGIYILFDRNKNPLYMGRAKNLKKRLTAYLYKRADNKKTKKKIELCKRIYYYAVHYCTELEAGKLERHYRKRFDFNTY